MSLSTNSTLRSVKLTGQIYDAICTFDVEQTYLSTNINPLEITYNFALDRNSVITSVKLQINDRILYGILNEKQTNRLNYDKAIENKHMALTLEKTWHGYSLKLGNIEPNQTIIIKYTYITTLKVINNSFVYNLPTNIAPKYTQHKYPNNNETEIEKDNKIEYTDNVGYDFHLNISVKSMNAITSIDSNNSNAKLNKITDNEYLINCITNCFDGDFVIKFVTEMKPAIYKYNEYLYLNFNFPSESVKSDLPKIYSIIVDRSGSMNDYNKIDYTREALEMFIGSLEKDSYFNIIGFGDKYKSLWKSPVIYNDSNIKTALDYAKNIKADMGGTELYKCLDDCINEKMESYIEKSWLSNTANTTEYENIIIVLTDGQIYGSNQFSDMIKKNRENNKFRIFTLGIGRNADNSELEKLANVGYGVCRMSSESINIADNVIDILDVSQKKFYTNIKYKDKLLFDCAYPNMFQQTYLKADENTIKLNADNATFDINPLIIEKGKLLEQLYWNNQITNSIGSCDIVEISKKYSILSLGTSFFLYDVEKIKTDGDLERENIKHHQENDMSENFNDNDMPKNFNDNDLMYTFKPCCAFMGSRTNRFVKKSAKLKSTISFGNSIRGALYSMKNSFDKFFSNNNKLNESESNKSTDTVDSFSTEPNINYNKTFVDFKLADGSFDFNDELIKLCGCSKEDFNNLVTKLNIESKTLINYIVLIRLEEKKETKYKLIIQNLIKYLCEVDKENYSEYYNKVKVELKY